MYSEDHRSALQRSVVAVHVVLGWAVPVAVVLDIDQLFVIVLRPDEAPLRPTPPVPTQMGRHTKPVDLFSC